MIRALGGYLTRGWPQAVLAVSVLTLISLLLMPLAFLLSGAPVGLVTLRRGPRGGIEVIAGVTAVLALMATLAGLGPWLAVAFAVSVWLPVWVCAGVLRRTESQAAAVLAAAGLAALFALAMYAAVPDVSGWWRGWVDTWMSQALPPGDAEKYAAALDTAAPLLNAMMAVATMLGMIAAVLVARAWQASLYNPGGFRREFYALRLPRTLVLPMAVAGLAVVMLEGTGLQLARDLLVVGLLAFLFHGVAAVHRTVATRDMNRGWLVGMYLLMFLLPQMALFVSCIGMADAWLGPGDSSGTV